MTTATGYYAIIQYIPDPSRLEAVNVGVVLFCPTLNYLDARTAAGNGRIRRFFGTQNIDREQLNTIKLSIQRRLKVDRGQFRVLADLERFAATRANSMRLTNPELSWWKTRKRSWSDCSINWSVAGPQGGEDAR